jgi:endonuclease/exonuclease/phosphatase family metal-dependent hydrolase
VWSKTDRKYPYVKAVIRAVARYRDLIAAQPTVVMGDFNSNSIWDRKRPFKETHSGLVQQLSALGLVSAYHDFHGEPHGGETRPTLYLLKQRQRPYHIDYCFVPRAWLSSVQSVKVGAYEDWIALSDHTPVSVELKLPQEAARESIERERPNPSSQRTRIGPPYARPTAGR